MAGKTKGTPRQDDEGPDKDGPDTSPDSPLLDLSDAAVKKLIRTVGKRGYVTHDQINALSKELSSEQIEDVLAMFSETGVNVVETEEANEDEGEREEPDEEAEAGRGELVEVQQKVPAKSAAKEPAGRTDDPFHMYLREMGSLELLSREGEIAIAKRIEAGREAMIAALCEKSAHLPGHHHLARRAQRRKGPPPRHHRSRGHLRGPRRQGDAGPCDRPRRPPSGAHAGAADVRGAGARRTGARPDPGAAGGARRRHSVPGGRRRGRRRGETRGGACRRFR